MRDLEEITGLDPPGPVLPITLPPAANVVQVIQIQTALIRTQAAYVQHLQELQTILGL